MQNLLLAAVLASWIASPALAAPPTCTIDHAHAVAQEHIETVLFMANAEHVRVEDVELRDIGSCMFAVRYMLRIHASSGVIAAPASMIIKDGLVVPGSISQGEPRFES